MQKGREFPAFLIAAPCRLANDEWKETHETRAFDCVGKGALMRCGKPRALARHDAAMRIEEALEELNVLVVDVLNIVIREEICLHSSELERYVLRINVFAWVFDRVFLWSFRSDHVATFARSARGST